MKKLIHNYLSNTFKVVSGNLYYRHDGYFFSYKFVTDLEKVFGLPRKKLKWYAKSWFIKNKANNFNGLWNGIYSFPVKGQQSLESGYIYAPYISICTPPAQIEHINVTFTITPERYNREINHNAYQEINLVN